MEKILLLTTTGGKPVAVFVRHIDLVTPNTSGRGTLVGLTGGNEAHITVQEEMEDILFSLNAAGIADVFRIRQAPTEPLVKPSNVIEFPGGQ